VTRLLVEAGADVNARDYLGSTVLHDAAVHRPSAALMCSLLKAGADATAVDTCGATAAGVAEAYQRSEAAALLKRAETDQRSACDSPRCAPALPMHLVLNCDDSRWQCSTDLAHRSAVFSHLADMMPLFSSQPRDRVELLRRVEFELYSTAADLAEYRDLKTVQQNVEPLCSVVRTQLQQRAAARVGAEAVVRGDSSAAVACVQQNSDDTSAMQQIQSDALSQTLSDQTTADLADELSSSSSSNDDAASVQSVALEQQQQQQQQAVAAAVTLGQSAVAEVVATGAVADSGERIQSVPSVELAVVGAEQQAVVDTTAGTDTYLTTPVLHDSTTTAVEAAITSSGTAVETSSSRSDATTAEMAGDEGIIEASNQADVSACATAACATPLAAVAVVAAAPAAAAAVPVISTDAAADVASDVAAFATTISVDGAGTDSDNSSECTCCDVTLQQELQRQSQRAAAAEQHADAVSHAATVAASYECN
jgi:Ankyrin repeats (many copies)